MRLSCFLIGLLVLGGLVIPSAKAAKPDDFYGEWRENDASCEDEGEQSGFYIDGSTVESLVVGNCQKEKASFNGNTMSVEAMCPVGEEAEGSTDKVIIKLTLTSKGKGIMTDTFTPTPYKVHRCAD